MCKTMCAGSREYTNEKSMSSVLKELVYFLEDIDKQHLKSLINAYLALKTRRKDNQEEESGHSRTERQQL